MPKGGEPECADISNDHVCAHDPRCLWDFGSSACHAKEEPPPCEGAHDEGDCNKPCVWFPNHGCILPGSENCESFLIQEACDEHSHDDCAWEEETHTCMSKHPHLRSCERFVEEEPCNKDADCTWHEKHSVCHHREVGVMCHQLYSGEACSSDANCVWYADGFACINKDLPPPCDRLQQGSCAQYTECVWSEAGEQCHDAHVQVTCVSLREQGCRKHSGCKWNKPSDICVDAEDHAECADLGTPKECYVAGCGWNREDGQNPHEAQGIKGHCEEQSNHALDAESMPDELGAARLRMEDMDDAQLEKMLRDQGIDAEYKDLMILKDEPADCSNAPPCLDEPTECPEGEVLGLHYKECCKRCGYEPRYCSDYFSKVSCPHKCQWSLKGMHCTAFGEKTPCTLFFDDYDCDKERCDWHEVEMVCTDKGAPVPCDRWYDAEECSGNGRCQWFEDLHLCHDKDHPIECGRITTGELRDCEKLPHCHYDADSSTCHSPGELVTCRKYVDEPGCLRQGGRCFWWKQQHQCHDSDSTLPCEAWITQKQCMGQERCVWDHDANGCFSDVDFMPVECSRLNREQCALAAHECEWHHGSSQCAGRGQHDKIPCHQVHAAGPCDEHLSELGGCKWSSKASLCYLAERLSAGPICDDISQKGVCLEEPECKWDVPLSRCYIEGKSPPCSLFYTSGNCNDAYPGHCEWHDDVGSCFDAGTLPECALLRGETECERRQGECEWRGTLCYDIGAPYHCPDITTAESCEHAAHHGCKWWKKRGQCIHEDSTRERCGYHQTHDDCLSDDAHHCAWDTKLDMCRPLKTNHDEL